MGDGRRNASVRASELGSVEVVTLDHESFAAVMGESEAARAELAEMARQRALNAANRTGNIA